jgi:hypothetical protein
VNDRSPRGATSHGLPFVECVVLQGDMWVFHLGVIGWILLTPRLSKWRGTGLIRFVLTPVISLLLTLALIFDFAGGTTRFPPYCNKSLRQHHYFGCNTGVLLHRNSDLVAICVSIATQNLSCIIYLFGCNMLTLMHPFLGFPLHLVGNNATPILCCISIPYVATESCV